MRKPEISDRFMRLKSLLLSNKYKVDTDTFSSLCQLHNYITVAKKDIDSKNELLEVFHDIFIEIFMPIAPGEGYEQYPDGKRVYFDAHDKIVNCVQSIFDLNVYSPVWLHDISSYYGVCTPDFEGYNQRRPKHKKYGGPDQSLVRGKILSHLQQYIDPDKPLEPKIKTPESKYQYEFETALYEENKVKNRFFQEMKYKFYVDLNRKKHAILNLKTLFSEPIEDYEDDEINEWKLVLTPVNNELLSKYNLFKDNPFVYVYRYADKEDMVNGYFTPSNSEFEGKVIKIDEERNTISIKISTKEFYRTKFNYFTSLVLRQDTINYERERKAVIDFVGKTPWSGIKRLIINRQMGEFFNDTQIVNYCTSHLTNIQKESVNLAIQAKDFYCIHGPPGTGKTKVSAEILIQFLMLNPYCRVLVTCASNEATDNILAAFKKILPVELHHIILRIGTEEKTLDNPDSFYFKITNSAKYLEEIRILEKEYEQNTKQLDSLKKRVTDTEKELNLINITLKSNNDELSRKSGDGINQKQVGIIPNIRKLTDDHASILKSLETCSFDKEPDLTKLLLRNEADCSKLVQQRDTLESDNLKLEWELQRIGSHLEKLLIQRTECVALSEQLFTSINIQKNELKSLIVKRKPIFIFSTNNHCSVLTKYGDQPFDLLVIDEITQSTQPSSLIPINQSKKVVIAGDHHQLPPTVFLKNKDYDEEIDPNYERQRIKSYQVLSESLFERLYSTIKGRRDYCIFLQDQFRMNPLLIEFLNKTIYKDTHLKSDDSTSKHFIDNGIFQTPLVFINHDVLEEKDYSSDEFSASKVEYSNDEEIRIVLSIVDKYLTSGVYPNQIGVVSPYKSQVRKLTAKLESKGLIAKTVDSCQGQEKEIIILSLVRSNLLSGQKPTSRIGFLVDERRFNVAITRFRRKLIIIGNKNTLCLSDTPNQEYYDIYDNEVKPIYYKSLIDYIISNGIMLNANSLDNFLLKNVDITINNDNNKGTDINPEFQEKLMSKVYNSLITKLNVEIKLIKRNPRTSEEEKVEEIHQLVSSSILPEQITQTDSKDSINNNSEEYVLLKKISSFRKTAKLLFGGLCASEEMELDWSAPIIEESKAFEEILKKSVFEQFKQSIRSVTDFELQLESSKRDPDYKIFVQYLIKDTKITLGNMGHFIKTTINCVNRKSDFLIGQFYKFLSGLHFKTDMYAISDKGLIKDIDLILYYRNPSAHEELTSKEKCVEGMKLLDETINNIHPLT